MKERQFLRSLSGIAFFFFAIVSFSRAYSTVYLPGTWDLGEFNTPFTNLYMPPGFVKATVGANRSDYFIIHNNGWATGTSWGATTVNTVDVPWTIARRDQGSTNWAQLTGGSWHPAQTRYLTVVSTTNPSGTSEKFGILRTLTTLPVYITGVSSSLSGGKVYIENSVTQTITLSAAKATEERVIVRYTTNGWTSSLFEIATGSGTAYTAVIPAMPSGRTVEYYAMTTTATDTYLTNGEHDYMTLSCFSNQSSPFRYYVSGTLHTIDVDGTNDFNTNDAELILTTTSGYTNWITWDSDYLYVGYFGADIGAASANKMLYIYIGTNTNRTTNDALITGSAYGEPQGSQTPVLPFQANFLVRYLSTGVQATAVWTGGTWDTASSPLNTGTSNVRIGNYVEFRISRTDLGSASNINLAVFMMDKTSGSEKLYGSAINNSLADGFHSVPSNYIQYYNTTWLSNRDPGASVYHTFDPTAPFTNSLITPTNNQTAYVGDTVVVSNYVRDETGIYRIDLYTDVYGSNTTVYVSNTNAVYALSLNTTGMIEGTYKVYTIAYDTRRSLVSESNTLSLVYNSAVYLPGTRWGTAQFGTPFTNLSLPPGFIKCEVTARSNDYFIIHNGGWATNTSWSANEAVNVTNSSVLIPRNDQPTGSNWARLGYTWPNSDCKLTVISAASPSGTNERFGFLMTTATPVTIAHVSNDSVAWPNSNMTVFITLSAAKTAGERIIVRYTTNSWSTPQFVAATGSSSNYTASIPAVPSGRLVRYYVLNTTAADADMTNGTHDYVTLSCYSNQTFPFSYYVSGSLHSITVDGVNDFNTNGAEQFQTTTSGYTNWITWDGDYLYIGYYGADLSANDANKMLYVYIGTNTNRTTNSALITGTAYGEIQGNQIPVLPFRANYFVRYLTTDSRVTAVWTNNAWNTSVSPLDAGISSARTGNFLEIRVARTGLSSSTNLNIAVFMLDKTGGSEKIYGAVPSDALTDGYRSNPSRFLYFTNTVWISNRAPTSSADHAYDGVSPFTNRLLSPTNYQTNAIGDIITLSNTCQDETGLVKIEVYTNLGGLYSTVWVSNTNATYTNAINTGTGFMVGTFYFYTIAYDTRNTWYSQTNEVELQFSGPLYMPGTRWNAGQYNTPFTNFAMPPGFVKNTQVARRNDLFMIHFGGWLSNSSWSSGVNISVYYAPTNIPRWDQGNTNWSQILAPLANGNYFTAVSYGYPTATNEKFGFLYTTAAPVYITVSSNTVNGNIVGGDTPVTVYATLSGAKSAQEYMCVRYTTNGWTNSYVSVGALVSGDEYSAVIPALASGSIVKFYVLTTAGTGSNYVGTSDCNYVTLSCFSNASYPYTYSIQGTRHTIRVDGTNDFNTNSAERLLTSTAGYTNWITWDSDFLYLGYYGADVGANDPDKMLMIYISTNTNTNTVTGWPYGDVQGPQWPVFPFPANYLVRYISTGSCDSAVWSAGQWDYAGSPLTSVLSNARVGNYVELRIPRTGLSSSTNLNIALHFLNKSAGSPSVYGSVPQNSLADGFRSSPSNYLAYVPVMWISNILPASNIYWSLDSQSPHTNFLLWPSNNQTYMVGNPLALSNYAQDNIGLKKIEVYTNTGALYTNLWISNTNALYTDSFVTTNFASGTYNFYTLAYDTRGVLSSPTNTNITFMTGTGMTVYKTISSIQLPPLANLLKPGALITYQIVYTNTGPLPASNVVIYDRIPANTTYYTNYAGTATGWTAEYAHIASPNQNYTSPDYDSVATNVTWFRWKKLEVTTGESGSTLFMGVTVN